MQTAHSNERSMIDCQRITGTPQGFGSKRVLGLLIGLLNKLWHLFNWLHCKRAVKDCQADHVGVGNVRAVGFALRGVKKGAR